MGVRLYPIAKQGVSEVEVFNKVAPNFGWSTISQERFSFYEGLVAKRDSNEISGDEYYETLYAESNGDIRLYNSFLVFGFGKFRSMFEEHRTYAGKELDQAKAKYLCMANDIPTTIIEVIDGFAWC